MASIRDYDQILREKPTMQQPAFYSSDGSRRIVHQVWDWVDDAKYVVHLYITRQTTSGWEPLHFVSKYHCILREQLSAVLHRAGFTDIEWLMPSDSGFYQPIVLGQLADVAQTSHRLRIHARSITSGTPSFGRRLIIGLIASFSGAPGAGRTRQLRKMVASEKTPSIHASPSPIHWRDPPPKG